MRSRMYGSRNFMSLLKKKTVQIHNKMTVIQLFNTEEESSTSNSDSDREANSADENPQNSNEQADLFVHSPCILDRETRKQLDKLGVVKYVVEPNRMHNQGLNSFLKAYPLAKFYAPPGLQERRKEIPFSVLNKKTEFEWEKDIDYIHTKGNTFLSEVFFYHKKSRTMIVGHFLEKMNWTKVMRGGNERMIKFFQWYYTAQPGTWGASPEFVMYTTHPEELDESRKYVLEKWKKTKRIIVSHGENVEEKPLEVLDKVYQNLYEQIKNTWVTKRWLNIIYRP